MDVYFINKQCSQPIEVEKETPLEVDAGYLAVTDPNPIDEEGYKYVAPPILSILHLTSVPKSRP